MPIFLAFYEEGKGEGGDMSSSSDAWGPQDTCVSKARKSVWGWRGRGTAACE